jgi:4-amino-4-deoxy-L-arabinose transferase-like glycosyltransferase
VELVRPSAARLVWVAAATLVALCLRAVFVGDQSLGYEEVFTESIVRHASAGGVWRAVRATESTPPLYYYLTWAWVRLTGDYSAVALRMTSVLAGIATVPVAFLAMRRFVGDGLSLVVAWLCAISPFLLEYSIYARSYALLVLVTLASLWAFGALLERPSRTRWALWSIAAVLCLWTHYFAAFTLVAEAVVLFVALPKERAKLVVGSLMAVATFGPLWSLFRAQSSATGRTAFITARPLSSRLEDVVRQFAMGTNVPAAWLEGTGIAVAGAALVFAVGRLRRRRSTQIFVVLALVGGGLPTLAAVAGVADYMLPRNIIGVWICLAPLTAYGLTRWRSVPLVLYSVLCLVVAIAVQTNWRYQGSADWGGVSARVDPQVRGEPIAVAPAMDVSVAALYLGRAPLSKPVSTRDLWVMVEPARGAHQRASAPVADVPLGPWSPALRAVAEIDYRGFRLIHLHSTVPSVLPSTPATGAATATALLAP